MRAPRDAMQKKPWRRWMAAGMLATAWVAVLTDSPLGQTAAETPAPAPGPEAVPPAAPAAPAPATPAAPAAPAPAAPAVPPVIEVKENSTIELHVKDQDLSTVLELLARQHQLNIVASKKATGKVSADLYRASLEQILDAVCRANGLKWVREGDFIYIHTIEEIAEIEQDESRLKTEVFVLNYLTSEEAQKIVAPALSKKAVVSASTKSEVGIPTGGEDAGGNTLGARDTIVVKDFPDNLEAVRAILAKMDLRPRQVLVEATILAVTLDDSNDLGVDFNALAGVDFRDLSVTTHPVTDTTIVPNAATTTLTVNDNRTRWGQARTQGFATAGDGLNIGVITNNVSFFVHALETVTDTTVLSNPKVLALNKQRAEVIIGDRLPYITTTVTETTAVQSVEFLETGTQLVFRPFISDDGYIRMEIHPKVSSGTIVNNLPREATTEVTCNVLVKGGHTIVIGGLFDETTSIGHTQIPGLGSIPGAGWLFRSRTESTVRREIIVLLTPHLIEEEEAYAMGEEALDDAHRRCFGMREGFAFYSRERLTAGYLQEADKFWRRYEETGSCLDRVCAWWNNQLALNVAPNDLKALRLKDKILGDKKGTSPKSWTLWDSINTRLKAIEQRQGGGSSSEAPKTEAPAAVPAGSPAAPPAAKPDEPSPTQNKPEDAAAPSVEEKKHE